MQRLCPNAAAGVIVGVLLFGGCSATHLHRGEDAELATRAAEDYAAIDLVSIIDTERDNLDATLAYELAVVDRLVDVILQREWYRLVSSDEPLSTAFMERVVAKRKSDLGVTRYSEDEISNLLRLEAEVRLLDRQMQEASESAKLLFAVDLPLCGSAALPATLPTAIMQKAREAPSGRRPDVLLVVFYTEYKNKCGERNAQIKNTLAPFEGSDPGLLGRTMTKWRTAQTALVEQKNRALEARAQYEAAERALQDTLDSRDWEAQRVVSEDLQAHAGRLTELLEQLEEDGGAVGLSESAFLRVRNIDVLLGAIVDAEVDETVLDDASVKKSAVVAASVSSLTDDIKQLYARRSLDVVSSLIVEKQRQLILRDLAVTRLARQERRVSLMRDKYIAVTDELEMLRTIENGATLQGVADVLARPASAALARRCDSQACAEVYRMFLKYIETVDDAQRRMEKIDYYLIDLDHRAALDESQTAIGLWNALVATPLQQLVAYHKGGVRSEALADLLIKFTTLGAIAVGVND